MVKKFEDMTLCNLLYTIPDGRTDRQTDGQTSCHGIVRAMHTRRAVKMCVNISLWGNAMHCGETHIPSLLFNCYNLGAFLLLPLHNPLRRYAS